MWRSGAFDSCPEAGPSLRRCEGSLIPPHSVAPLGTAFNISNDGMSRGITRQLQSRRLLALAIVTSNYTTGQSVTWIQGRDLKDWERPERRSRQTAVSVDHVMASAALPLFFPAVQLEGGWYGDGGIRLTAPCSPAIHLGATRILSLSTRYTGPPPEVKQSDVIGYPPPLQISGQLLNCNLSR